MRILLFIAAMMIGIATEAAAKNEETLAEPLRRITPNYPAACIPTDDSLVEKQSVTVTYSVSESGRPTDVRVMETSDPCFNETAIAAIRGATFVPRRVNGVAQIQEDVETTFTFILDGVTTSVDFDARPLKRIPPRYPDKCQARAKTTETVILEFDVTVDGTTDNIRVVESTSSCFEFEAKYSVRKWRYHPKTVAGKPVARKGVRTAITFMLASGPSDTPELRKGVRKDFVRVRKILDNNGDPKEALAILMETEAKFGDDFTREELSLFHQLRGASRIKAGDYTGALDDLRIAKSYSMSNESLEAVSETVAKLEEYLGIEPGAPTQQPEPSNEQENGQDTEE